MLHNETRNLIIQAWNKTHNAKEIAEYFSVNTSTVYRLEKRMRETGSIETRTSLRGRKPALTQKDIQNIDQLIQQQPNITINEILEKLQLHVSDESGVNTNMTRHYARSKKSKRAIDSTPINMPCNTTILSSIRLSGKTAYTVYQGRTTKERFAEYLKSTLLPTLAKTDIVVMDNMRSHHAQEVKQILDTAGIKYLYLPPYSPDLNPIEKMWSKIKAYLRKEKIRIASELSEAITRAFLNIQQSDCLGWFRSCNYVQ